MINFSLITKAAFEMLDEAPQTEGYTVENGVLENVSPGRCPWIGVYRNKIGYTPRRMGKGANNWANEIKLDIVVQATDQIDSAEEALETQIKNVLDVLEADRTLKGTVRMILGYDISYFFREGETEDVYFQKAVITITAEAIS